MNDDHQITSAFGSGTLADGSPLSFDFASARRLDRSGSTCDAYVCNARHRRLFVKRLKPEFRDNPLYRAAFDKEYDLGLTLDHVSLPRYIAFGGDYIVMNYIEGDTLADLMRRGDRRLSDRRFVTRLLTELVDVVGYLHRLNIVHCDIKADNIIVSPYDDRPATLVDLDKAYTAWLDDTPGDPAIYDCDNCADGSIDFHGIGNIARRLGMPHIAAACHDSGVTPDKLRKLLRRRHPARRILFWLTAIGIILVAALTIRHLVTPETQQAPLPSDTIAVVPTVSPVDTPTVVTAPPTDTPAAAIKTPTAPGDDTTLDVDAIVGRYYGPLYPRHEYLRKMAADSTTTARQLQTVINTYVADQTAAQSKIITEIAARYKLTDTAEATAILGTSNEWRRFMQADYDISTLYSHEIAGRQ